MKKSVIGVAFGTGLLLSSSIISSTSASTSTNEEYYVKESSTEKSMDQFDQYEPQNAFMVGVAAGVLSAAAYDGIKAAGSYLNNQHKKATAKGVYKAAPSSSYASAGGRVTARALTIDQIPVADIKEFGR